MFVMVLFRHILELGAGSGLLGLALLKSSEKIRSYTFTDYSPMILNLLQQNVLLNFPEDQPHVMPIGRLIQIASTYQFSLDPNSDRRARLESSADEWPSSKSSRFDSRYR